MADWQAFATAFLGDSATYINERKDKAEDYAEKLAEQAERNKGKLSQLRQAADAQNAFVGQARDLHASDAQIEAALDAGPDGLGKLVTTLDTLRATYGSNFNADMVKEAAALPEAFSPTGNLDVYARYGLGSQVMGDIEAPKGGWFARAMGTDAKARARAEADAEAFGGTGMSVYDMAELDSVTGYTSRNSGSYLRYTPPKMFNPANTAEAQELLIRQQALLVDSVQYKAFDDMLAAQDKLFDNSEAVSNAKAIIRQDQKDWLRNSLTSYAKTQTDMYGNSWVDAMGPVLSSLGLTSDSFTNTQDTSELNVDAVVEEPFNIADYTLPKTLTVSEDGLANGTVTIQIPGEKEGTFEDNTFELVNGLVVHNGETYTEEVSEMILRSALTGVTPATVAATAAVTEGGAEVDAEVIEDPIMAAYQEYGQSRKAGVPLTAEDVRSQMGDVGQTLSEAATVAVDWTVGAAQTVDRGLAYATKPISKFTNGTAMVMGSIMDAVGMPGADKAADNLFAFVADSVNGRQTNLDKGLFASLLDNEGNQGDPDVPSIYEFFKNVFDIDKKDIENSPEAVASIEQLAADIQANKRQRIGTVGFQDLGLREDVRSTEDMPETASDTNLDRMEQSRLGRVGAESDRISTESKSMPGATELQALPETPERRANAARDQRVSNEVNRRELTEGATRIAEMLSRPTSEVSQEEVTKFIMEVNAKFGEDAVKAELQRVIRGRAAKGGTE